MVKHNLPFEVGQEVESRSHIKGYRGAWFRCKITKILSEYDKPLVALEYLDYPDEKIKRIHLYQRVPSVGGIKSNEKQLMVRPPFPPVYRKSEKPDVSNIPRLVDLAEDEWRVGDLVDWLADGCYWSGRVIEVLDNEKLQIELPPPPKGEGLTYDNACSKDLRPSLDWSPESGWTLPFIREVENYRHCAQLIMPPREGYLQVTAHDFRQLKNLEATVASSAASGPLSPPENDCNSWCIGRAANISVAGETRENIMAGGSSNISFPTQTQPRSSSPSVEAISDIAAEGALGTDNSRMTPDPLGLGIHKQKDKETNAETPLEKLKSERAIYLNSTSSDTLEDAILDLEKLASQVRVHQDTLTVGRHPKTT